MISLEKRGVMSNKFKKPFRRKPLWSVDWSDYEAVEGNSEASLSDLGSMLKTGVDAKGAHKPAKKMNEAD